MFVGSAIAPRLVTHGFVRVLCVVCACVLFPSEYAYALLPWLRAGEEDSFIPRSGRSLRVCLRSSDTCRAACLLEQVPLRLTSVLGDVL